MDVYSIFKFLHVICAIAWVGGGLTLIAANIFLTRAKGDTELFATLNIMNVLGKTWFVPASMLTVLFGAIVTTLGGMWLQLWVLLGLAGFASTFFTGLTIIEPTGRQIAAALEQGRNDDALVMAKRLMQISKFDYTVILVVVADMVLKPNWLDIPTLIVFAAAIGAGAYFFLYGGKLPTRPQAA